MPLIIYSLTHMYMHMHTYTRTDIHAHTDINLVNKNNFKKPGNALSL